MVRRISIISILLSFLGLTTFAEPGYEDMTPQEARFAVQIDNMSRLLNQKKPLEEIIQESAGELRGNAFALEEFFKAYSEQHKDLSPFKAPITGVEDRVGRFIDTNEHIEKALAMGYAEDSKMLVFLRGVRHGLLNEAKNYLSKGSKNWLNVEKGPLSEMKKTLKKTEWEGANKDREFILNRLIEMVRLVKDKQYHMDELQGGQGVHELRRNLREITILISALNKNGKAVLDPTDIPGYLEEYTGDKALADFKYSKLGEKVPSKRPVVIKRPFFLGLTKWIDSLGTAKDVGEADHEWLPTALVGSGELEKREGESEAARLERAKELAKKIVPAKFPNYVDLDKTVRELYKKIKETPLLADFEASLTEQLDWSKADCKIIAKKLGRH